MNIKYIVSSLENMHCETNGGADMFKLMKPAALVAVFVIISTLSSGCFKGKSSQTATSIGSKTETKTGTGTTPKARTTMKQATTGVTDSMEIQDDDAQNTVDDGRQSTEDVIDRNIPDEYVYDYNGREIYILAAGKGTKTVSDYSPMGNQIYVPNTNLLWDLEYAHYREIEKKFNCKLVVESIYPQGTISNNMMKDILAGSFKYSLVYCYGAGALPLLHVSKMLYPLNGFLEYDRLPKLKDPVFKTFTNFCGNYYIMPFNEPWIYDGLIYNIEVRDRMGLPDPYNLYRQGLWNWETLANLAVQATVDVNGDGFIDQYGLNIGNVALTIEKFIQSNNGVLIDFQNGKFVNRLNTPQNNRALTFVSNLVNIYKVSGGNYDKGEVFMLVQASMQAFAVQKFNLYQIKSRFIHIPAGPDSIDGKCAVRKAANGLAIPITVQDPQAAAYLLVNLQWTFSDPEKPKLAPEVQNEENLKLRMSQALGWMTMREDWGDLLDYWRVDLYSTLLSDNMDYYSSTMGDVPNYMTSQVFPKIVQMVPISTIIYEAEPAINSMLSRILTP